MLGLLRLDRTTAINRWTASQNSSLTRRFIAGTFVCLILLTACNHPYDFHGPAYNLPHPAPDFTITDVNGKPYHLAERRGRAIVLYFGYTNCPDICPTTLAMLSTLRKKLPASPLDVVFLTIDPDRDTADAMKAYLKSFDPAIIGISATKDVIQPLVTSYGGLVTYQRDGTVQDHSSYVYLIDPAGNWRTQYDYTVSADDLMADVEYVLSQKG